MSMFAIAAPDAPEPAPPDGDLTGAVVAQARPQSGPQDEATQRALAIRMLTLRTQAFTYDQIADAVGYADGRTARRALKRILESYEAESAAELRQVENARLDTDERALRAIIADTTTPLAARIRAVDARTRLSARRARLNGLDAPVAVAISAGVQAELTDVLAELDTVIGDVISSRTLDLEEDTDA